MQSDRGEYPPKVASTSSADSFPESTVFPSAPPYPKPGEPISNDEPEIDGRNEDDTFFALMRAIESTGLAAHLQDPSIVDVKPSIEQRVQSPPERDNHAPATKTEVQESLSAAPPPVPSAPAVDTNLSVEQAIQSPPKRDSRMPAIKTEVQESLPAALHPVPSAPAVEEIHREHQHSSGPDSDSHSNPVLPANGPDITASSTPQIAEQLSPKTPFLVDVKKAINRGVPQVRSATGVLLRHTEKKVSTWLNKALSPDKRRSPRFGDPPLAAYYWTGGAPEPHRIANISFSGLYVLTNDRWYPGSRITMTLQRTDLTCVEPKEWISVDVHIVRSGKDGVGGAFLFPEKGLNGLIASPNSANKKTVARFVKQLMVGSRP